MNKVSGNYQYLNDSAGLIRTFTYAASTGPSVDEDTSGDVKGYLKSEALKRGETGTEVPQMAYLYYQRTAGGQTVNPVAASTVFRNDDGTGSQTTVFSYTWFAGTTQVESTTVMRPTVTVLQNGPGAPDVSTSFADSFGRETWRRDEDGFIHYTEFDQRTGAVTKTIVDVNTSLTGDFTGLPSGWSTPAGGGLHLVTTMEVDFLGRATKLTLPAGNISYTVFNDANYEVRSYAGWNASTNTPTGPTVVSREDRPGSYTETLTMSAAPAVSLGRPTGTESIASVETLSRSYVSAGGQVSHSDAYFNLTGLTYSTSTSLGTENTHFYRTRFGYDQRGRQDRVEAPTGTINRTAFDGLSRTVSFWVGLDDTPTSGEWSPTNTAGTDLVKVSENVYDAGGVGDSNLTQTTQFVGLAAADRVSQFFFDWRNRLVATKGGVQGSESADTQRPITYTELDNLGQALAQEYYDGDAVAIVDANSDGIPDKPASSLRRARSTAEFDELGRAFRTHLFSVDQTTGVVSVTSLMTDMFFDHRSNLIKQSAPGGLVSKFAHDGAGRQTKSFTSDGGGDLGWADADDVTGDKVLEQTQNTFDANSNVIFVTAKQRFHDETATGELGSPTTAPKARVSYMASYFDLGDRLTDTVNVGTNGGTAYVRPSTVPTRSDTVLVTSQAYNSAGWVFSVVDPRGIEARTFFDNLGRTTKTVAAYTDGVPSDNDDRTTEYTYDGSSNVLTVKALLTGGAFQTTEYVYAVRTSTGSALNSNDILSEVKHPDPATGNPSGAFNELYTINAVGQNVTFQDRNDSVHSYSYDVLGRTTADAITTLGTGVDGSIRRLEFSYDTLGRPFQFTSYNAATGGSIVNQVQQEYNGLSQMVREYQEHAGPVNTLTTLKVQYVYSEMAAAANHSRLTSRIYPNGRALVYLYGPGLDDSISRLTSIVDGATILESLTYLGLASVVERNHPEPNVNLTYVQLNGEALGDAGDQYTGLDRFGRIIDHRWMKNSAQRDRYQYAYDRNSNRTSKVNALEAALNELYSYDQLNQLVTFSRADGHNQSWSMDAQGNFSTVTTDGTPQARTHDAQNRATVVGGNALTYDSNGNMTTDETGRTFSHDAWNRLVQGKAPGGATLDTFAYDALFRRISENPGILRDLYYSDQWQVLEERTSGATRVQQVWSPVYVDAMIVRYRDSDNNGTLDETLYALQDANFNVTAVVNTNGAVQERNAYDPYGLAMILAPNWTPRATSTVAWVYQHQGLRFEFSVGLDYNRIRDYSPSLMRFVQQDPVPATNLYVAYGNGPVVRVDPSGLDFRDWVINLIYPGFPMPYAAPLQMPRHLERIDILLDRTNSPLGRIITRSKLGQSQRTSLPISSSLRRQRTAATTSRSYRWLLMQRRTDGDSTQPMIRVPWPSTVPSRRLWERGLISRRTRAG